MYRRHDWNWKFDEITILIFKRRTLDWLNSTFREVLWNCRSKCTTKHTPIWCDHAMLLILLLKYILNQIQMSRLVAYKLAKGRNRWTLGPTFLMSAKFFNIEAEKAWIKSNKMVLNALMFYIKSFMFKAQLLLLLLFIDEKLSLMFFFLPCPSFMFFLRKIEGKSKWDFR